MFRNGLVAGLLTLAGLSLLSAEAAEIPPNAVELAVALAAGPR